jgi:hypothetical protein
MLVLLVVLCAYTQDETDADLDEVGLYFDVAELADVGLMRLGGSEDDSKSVDEELVQDDPAGYLSAEEGVLQDSNRQDVSQY